MKTLHFVAGLPRSGATMMINILKQNTKVDGVAVSSLASVLNAVQSNWNNIEANREYPNEYARLNVLKGILESYHKTSTKDIIFDKDRMWISKIPLLENLLQQKVKILCPVRNPAEILSSFERIRKDNPTRLVAPELNGANTVAARAMYYSSPDGVLGLSHAMLKDALVTGYEDRLLFVDYNVFCNNPKSQIKRIYNFFELPKFEHNFQQIQQTEVYNDLATDLPNLHKVKPRLEKTTTNCVEYIGLDLYQQYNSQIFWDALI